MTITLAIISTFLLLNIQTSTQLITVPIVQKAFVKKNGVATEHKEYYIQRSIQDYFIKFCESKVTEKELELYLAKFDSEIPTATLEVEFKEGSWDICNPTLEQQQQSRIGEYVIIHRIISK